MDQSRSPQTPPNDAPYLYVSAIERRYVTVNHAINSGHTPSLHGNVPRDRSIKVEHAATCNNGSFSHSEKRQVIINR
jgi:hypothetical protein